MTCERGQFFTLDVMIRHGQFRFPPRKLGIHDVERGRDGGDGGYRDNDMEKSRLICFLRVWHFLLWHTRTHIQVYLHPHMHPHMHHQVLATHARKEMLGPLKLGYLLSMYCR